MMTKEQALENLVTAAKMGKYSLDDSTAILHSIDILRVALQELQGYVENGKDVKNLDYKTLDK